LRGGKKKTTYKYPRQKVRKSGKEEATVLFEIKDESKRPSHFLRRQILRNQNCGADGTGTLIVSKTERFLLGGTGLVVGTKQTQAWGAKSGPAL